MWCIAADQGQTTPRGQNLMSIETSCHFGYLLQVSQKFLWRLIFSWVYTCIKGLTTPWGRNFYVNGNILSLRSFVASLKVISLTSDFIQFLSLFYTCIWPRGRDRQSQGTKFWCQQKRLSLPSFVASFIKISESDLIQLFYLSNIYI